MLYTIISLDDVFYSENDISAMKNERSSNPYDYIRAGWFLDNRVLFEGVNNVSLNSNFASRISGYNIHISD